MLCWPIGRIMNQGHSVFYLDHFIASLTAVSLPRTSDFSKSNNKD